MRERPDKHRTPKSARVSRDVGTTQHSLPLVLIRSSHGYIKTFSVYRYPSFLDIIKTIISNNKSYYSNNYILRYLLILISIF